MKPLQVSLARKYPRLYGVKPTELKEKIEIQSEKAELERNKKVQEAAVSNPPSAPSESTPKIPTVAPFHLRIQDLTCQKQCSPFAELRSADPSLSGHRKTQKGIKSTCIALENKRHWSSQSRMAVFSETHMDGFITQVQCNNYWTTPAPRRSFVKFTEGKPGAHKIDKDGIASFPHLCKKVLQPGSYVVLLQQLFACSATCTSPFLHQAFKSCRIPMFYPSTPTLFQLATHNASLSVARTSVWLLTRPVTVCLAAQLIFMANFKHLACCNDRILATTHKISQPEYKVTKKNLRSPYNFGELSVKMISDMMDILTPQSGLVLDPSVETMRTGTAALFTGRPCFLLEN